MEPDYKCTQDELYEGCELLLTSLNEELAKLAAFKAKYDPAFVTAFESTIKTAKELPNDDQRAPLLHAIQTPRCSGTTRH